jgi:hypothetical protein
MSLGSIACHSAIGRGIFVTDQITISEVLSQKDTSENSIPEPFFFPGIDITNTSPSLTKFWVIMHSGTYFL